MHRIQFIKYNIYDAMHRMHRMQCVEYNAWNISYRRLCIEYNVRIQWSCTRLGGLEEEEKKGKERRG